MSMRHACTVLAAAILLNAVGKGEAQSKPTRTEISTPYYKAPPGSLSAMLAEAELVIVGRVLRETPADPIDSVAAHRVWTRYAVELHEVVRNVSQFAVDDAVEVMRAVGDRDRGSYIERLEQEGFPRFQSARRYVLFLVWNAALGAWVPAFGPDSFIDLTDALAAAAGTSKVIASLHGKPSEQVVQTLRRGGD